MDVSLIILTVESKQEGVFPVLMELAFMCKDLSFDKTRAKELLQSIDVNQEFADPEHGIRTTLLNWAATWANVPMAELLLQHGADPNLIYDNGTENALWNLQYADGESADENQRRLKIVQLLLENGADPHLQIEGEDLLLWAISYWGEDEGIQSDYREEFIRLLEEYEK